VRAATGWDSSSTQSRRTVDRIISSLLGCNATSMVARTVPSMWVEMASPATSVMADTGFVWLMMDLQASISPLVTSRCARNV